MSRTPALSRRARALRNGLRKLGWVDGRSVEIVSRWADNAKLLPIYAAELVTMNPSVIVAAANPAMVALHQETTVIPMTKRREEKPSEQ